MRRTFIATGIVFSYASVLLAQALFPKPVKVLGDPNFIGTAASPEAFDTFGPNYIEGREFSFPTAVALDNSVSPPIVYVADSGNHRVLGYRYATQLVAGAHADIVIGQAPGDFFANGAQNPANGGRQSGLNDPTGLAVDSAGNLYVADSGNNRVLRYPQPFNPANANQLPNLVIGQKTPGTSTANFNGIGASTLSLAGQGRTGIALDAAGNLWVADVLNNRVLRFPAAALAAGANFPAADLVLGQLDFVTGSTKITAQTRTNLTGFLQPEALAFDSSGNLYVTDVDSRVVVYNAPLTTGMSGSAALGIDSTATTLTTQIALNIPLGVVFPGGGTTFGPIVADTINNRLMQYPPQTNWPAQGTQFSPSALSQVGQSSFTVGKSNGGNADASASTFSAPTDMAVSATELFVVDTNNNRVLVFPYSPTSGIGPAASRVIGQLDFPYRGQNLVDGKGFNFAAGFPAGAVLDTSVTPAHLYVADTRNNRILGYKDFTHLQNGQPADLVIGQPDFSRIVVNYPSSDGSAPSASSLSSPTALAIDSAGNLYVADTGNNRVLRFPAPYKSGMTALEPADLVIGQSGFTSVIGDATASTMNSPTGIALTSGAANASGNTGYLVVADPQLNRVLLFSRPFISGENASVVLGQNNFTNSGAGGSSTGLSSPRGVATDSQDHIFVADTSNARVQIFDQASKLATFGATPLITLGGFGAPLGVGVGTGDDFWVDDYSANGGRMDHYPSVSALPLANNASDTAFPVLGPHSGFVDPYNNLVVTDSINRVLYFVPQVAYQNAANYSSRPLAAGTIAALYPSVTTNSIAGGTSSAPANQFPMPFTLSDTQVTVNGTAAPLYFVSPGQDNIILPQGLASTGSANLLVTRASTGQILGAAEIALQASSPALFTNPPVGSGQLLAVNLDDGSTNSGISPVVRNHFIILYGTGVGAVPNAPADGAAASGQPAADLPLVYIAAASGPSKFIKCTVQFSGLAPTFAGLWQINVQIPQDAASGSAVVLELFEDSIPNLDQSSGLTTTLAVN